MQPLDDRIVQQMIREQQIDLRRYGNVLARRKWLVLGVAAAATLLLAGAAFLLPPVYRASAILMIEAQEASVISIQNVYGIETRGQEYYQTQFEILKSRPLAEAVAKKLTLSKQAEFNPAPLLPNFWSQWLPATAKTPLADKDATFDKDASFDKEAATVDRYLQHLLIQPKAKTQLVTVSFDAYDPTLAVQIANAHAQAFIENHMEAKETMTRTAADWMSGRLQDLRQKLAASEKNLQDFKEREQLVDIDGMKTLPAQELTELTTKLVEARRSLSEGRNTYQQVSQARTAQLDDKLAIPAVAADPVVQQFKRTSAEAEARVAELARRYGPQHPKMKAAISERDAALQQLTRQADSAMAAAKNQYDVLHSQEQALSAAMSDTKTHVNIAGRKEAEYRQLLREVETNRQLYELFYKRISETTETGDLATANARIIEPAVLPSAPVKPRRALMIGMGCAVGLMMGVMLAFLLEVLSNTIRHGADVAEKLGVPLLGLVPLLRRAGRRSKGALIGHQFLERDQPAFNEAIRTLRTGINLSGLDKQHKIIMVTSSLGDEGKTSVASNLALAFAQLERVLLIDTDMRRPTLAQEFEIARDHPGLSALCAGSAGSGDCIVRRTADNIDVLIAGVIPPNPQELLASQKFRQLLTKLAERYDRVILDCPPILPISDALLLANVADAAIYVVRAEKTSVAQIKRGIEQLQRTRIDLLGVVLNGVEPRKIAAYGEYSGAYLAENYSAVAAN